MQKKRKKTRKPRSNRDNERLIRTYLRPLLGVSPGVMARELQTLFGVDNAPGQSTCRNVLNRLADEGVLVRVWKHASHQFFGIGPRFMSDDGDLLGEADPAQLGMRFLPDSLADCDWELDRQRERREALTQRLSEAQDQIRRLEAHRKNLARQAGKG